MKNESAKKNKIVFILLFVVLLAGLSLLLYPIVSDYWNSLRQSRAIATYMQAVTELDDTAYERWWKEAEAYNAPLINKQNRFQPDEDEKAAYEKLLDISGSGIIGYVKVPSINVTLPIYHGTDEEVLQVAIGHIEGSSLPVGGAKYPLRVIRASWAAFRQAVHRSGSADRGGHICSAGAG